MLHRDPVCGMIIDENKDCVNCQYNGKLYYFCAEDCKERFLNTPITFIGERKSTSDIFCISCGTQVKVGLYIGYRGPYCCERCHFRDRFIGDLLDKVEGIYIATIEAFVEALDAKEHEVGNHSYRVTQFAMVIARRMGLKGRDLVDVYCGSLLHDLGKIGIPDSILSKRGRLTPDEKEIMEAHPEIGYRIINHIDYFSKVSEIIYSHHEHYDGSGYPRALQGKEISIGSRIFAACDTLDALTVDRPYRAAVSFDEAKRYILDESGKMYDPEVIEVFRETEDELLEFVSRIVL
jgi:putative nucleotidyltransferase with HDIG domain